MICCICDLYHRMGRNEDACNLCSEVIKFSREVFGETMETVSNIKDQFNFFIKINKFDNAKQVLKEGYDMEVKLNKTSHEILEAEYTKNLGYAALMEQKFDEALIFYEKAIKLYTENAGLISAVGYCFNGMGEIYRRKGDAIHQENEEQAKLFYLEGIKCMEKGSNILKFNEKKSQERRIQAKRDIEKQIEEQKKKQQEEVEDEKRKVFEAKKAKRDKHLQIQPKPIQPMTHQQHDQSQLKESSKESSKEEIIPIHYPIEIGHCLQLLGDLNRKVKNFEKAITNYSEAIEIFNTHSDGILPSLTCFRILIDIVTQLNDPIFNNIIDKIALHPLVKNRAEKSEMENMSK